MQVFQSTERDLASTRDRSCFSPQFPGSHFQAGCQISIEGQAYVRSKLSYQKYRTTLKLSQHTWPLPVKPVSIVRPRAWRFLRGRAGGSQRGRSSLSCQPRRRRLSHCGIHCLQRPRRLRRPVRGRDSGVIQDSRRTNTPRTPCQPKHLLAFTVPARLIRGNIGNPTGLATDPEKTSNMLGTENLFSQTLQAS